MRETLESREGKAIRIVHHFYPEYKKQLVELLAEILPTCFSEAHLNDLYLHAIEGTQPDQLLMLHLGDIVSITSEITEN